VPDRGVGFLLLVFANPSYLARLIISLNQTFKLVRGGVISPLF